MKLSKVIIRNFKRFDEVVFDIPDGGVVVAGPNNCGKTTLLQAIATWNLALRRWSEMDDNNPRNAYIKAPMSRQSLYSVPLRSLDALWRDAKPSKGTPIEISLEIGYDEFPIEIHYDTTEQMYVRPKATESWRNITGMWAQDAKLSGWCEIPYEAVYGLVENFVFIPSMTGISIEEPLYQRAKIQQLMGQSRPGEALRNLLVEAHRDQSNWKYICSTIQEIFGYELLPPDSNGASIIAEYKDGKVKLDIASAGSGFLQVLLLLAFFVGRKDCVLLLDEPDAHLHILLQDRIYAKLKEFARKSNSTLIMATHSERIINAVPSRQICSLLAKPKLLVSDYERERLTSGLGFIDNADILLAEIASGILYVEGPSDISILREWARVLNHPLLKFLESPFWKPSVNCDNEKDIFAVKHFRALQQINPKISGIELYDKDREKSRHQCSNFRGRLKRVFWRRYEIENYLMHPETVANFIWRIARQREAGEKAMQHMQHTWSPAFCEKPWDTKSSVNSIKGKDLLSEVFQVAGIENFYNYPEMAAAMPKKAIHPEVVEKLDAIAKAFGIM